MRTDALRAAAALAAHAEAARAAHRDAHRTGQADPKPEQPRLQPGEQRPRGRRPLARRAR